MPAHKNSPRQNREKSLTIRSALLVVQMLLPFRLYAGLRWLGTATAVLIGAVMTIGRLYQVWLG
ncbi:MAG: hypothetical protein WCY93_08420 [Anaerolineaceae bacterium]